MAVRPDRRQARQSLLWGSGVLFLMLTGFIVAIDEYHPELFDVEHESRMALLKARLAENSARPLCLTLGTSRMGLAFLPEKLPTYRDENGQDILVFNFSHFGSAPAMHWMQLHRIFGEGIRPDWVFLDLVPGHLAAPDDNFVGLHVGARDLPVLHDFMQPRKLYPRYLTRHLELAPRYPAYLLGLDPEPEFQLHPLGGYVALRDRIDRATRKEKMEHTVKFMYDRAANLRLAPRPVRLLNECVDFCHAHGARVAIVLMPEGSRFRSWYSKEGLKQLDAYLAELGRNGVPLVDARLWLKDGDFYDDHHVMRSGAEKFTARFGRDVLAPLFEANRQVAGGEGNRR